MHFASRRPIDKQAYHLISSIRRRRRHGARRYALWYFLMTAAISFGIPSQTRAETLEEGETSSSATVSIPNDKPFAEDQVLAFALEGRATNGIDHMVSPDDAEAVRIVNRRMQMPRITLGAQRDTIIAGLDFLVLTASREGSLDNSLSVTMQLTQEHGWLTDASITLVFPAGRKHSSEILPPTAFSSAVVESGTLTATLDSVSGYDTGDAAVSIFLVSQEGPAVKVFFHQDSLRVREDGSELEVVLVARAAAGMPRGATFDAVVTSAAATATSPEDYEPLPHTVVFQEEAFMLVDGLWQAELRMLLSPVDDNRREGSETFDVLIGPSATLFPEVQFSDTRGAPCPNECRMHVEITDDEDIPAFALSLSEDEIHEEGETSSIATISITNGKTFATDEIFTFELGSDAIPGHDYNVTPADVDDGTGHQAILPVGFSFLEVGFTAIDDEREEGDKEIRFRATHDGNAIDKGAIRIVDRALGPEVDITFEDVRAPRDEYTAGVATGPFTTRFTFSEPVSGFTEEDIRWSTHSLTTIDTTNIGVIIWDYTEVRPGLEYTARMMPDQNGRLWIIVDPGVATSVGTGDGNEIGAKSLWVDLPPNRLMVEPRTLTVTEGDTDGAHFLVVPTSPPTGDVTVTVTGMDSTDVDVDWSTWTFGLPYWNGGWAVKVTAVHDADAANEQVGLWVKASGGGYDGRGADLVVNIRDDEANSGGDVDDREVDDQAAVLSLLEGVTAAAAAAALFGEGDLSEAQLAALDLLGNRNGTYDLGDLLSWISRCERGEAECGDTSSPASHPVAGAAVGLAAGARKGRSGQGGSPRDRSGRLMGRIRHRRSRSRAAWLGVPLLLAAALAWACTDDVLPAPSEADPGYLAVRLTSPPDAHDIGAMLLVEGPGIEAVRASGFALFEAVASSPTRREVIVSGALSTAPVLEFQVPDRRRHAEYRVRLLEVAAEDYSPRDLAVYSAHISR